MKKLKLTPKRLPLTQFALLSLILVLAAFLLGLRPIGGAAQTIIIPEGASRVTVAKELSDRHLIRSETHFLALMTLMNTNIQAGTYAIDPKRGLVEILYLLHVGPDKNRIRITIPEGWRKEQIAQLLTEKGLDGAGFLTLVAEKEGYLFPDTYFFPTTATAQDVLDKFSQNYTVRTLGLNVTREQLIIASIVEREAKRDDERALIAGIYMNRINRGIALEADPTVQYGKETNLLSHGQPVTHFWQPITLADHHTVDSLYNTYLHSSYPPGPICNPGLKSIDAALHPQTTDAIYFFHTTNGMIITSKTMEEHLANKKRYL